MRWVGAWVAAWFACTAAHNGYPNTNAPWKRAQVVPFQTHVATLEGDLDFAARRRAKWFRVALDTPGVLDVQLSVTGEADDSAFNVAVEVYSPSLQILARDDARAYASKQKRITATAAEPGNYLIHLYLHRANDASEYKLVLQLTGGELPVATTVAMPPRLPVVPLMDDTLAEAPPAAQRTRRPPAALPEPRPTPPPRRLIARIINVTVGKGATTITVNRGTKHGLTDQQTGHVVGVRGAEFRLIDCGSNTCRAHVNATPDQLQRAATVEITP